MKNKNVLHKEARLGHKCRTREQKQAKSKGEETRTTTTLTQARLLDAGWDQLSLRTES